jgi:DNA-directed RNA polymerase specialized sigma24 family protein
MFKANQVANMKDMEYATAGDFCQIFDKDMNSLYLLSLLLAGDRKKAEQCFVEGLENAMSRNRVFKEWARSWARRAIIQNALRIVNPRPDGGDRLWDSATMNRGGEILSERAEIRAVLGLRPFDRFVFVMSVLEGYSDHDCAILLGCARQDVLAAKTRALQQIGSVAELRLKQEGSIKSEELLGHQSPSSVVEAAA